MRIFEAITGDGRELQVPPQPRDVAPSLLRKIHTGISILTDACLYVIRLLSEPGPLMAEVTMEEFPIPNDPPENEEAFEETIALIKTRCDLAKIGIKDAAGFMYAREYNVAIKQGRGARDVNLWSNKSARQFLDCDFESYRFIAGLSGIYSKDNDVIECGVRGLSQVSPIGLRARLFGLKKSRSRTSQEIVNITFTGTDDKIVELGTPSKHFTGMTSTPPVYTIKLRGFGSDSHEKSLFTLNTISDSLLYQIDLMSGTALGLVRERSKATSNIGSKEAFEAVADMSIPTHEYDHGPVSLYQYARSAVGMPLLQFLAYYQVVESYFPAYSDISTRKRIKNILKDPRFTSEKDADIGRIILALQGGAGSGFGSEREQLKATLNECLDDQDAREFIESDKSRAEHFATTSKSMSYHRVILADTKANLLNDIALRLYDIRCDIVHTKESNGMPGGRLLPFTKESDQIVHDIELMRFAAQKVLIAASRSLS